MTQRGGGSWGVALVLSVGLSLVGANLASAAGIHIGGIDTETQYNRPGAPEAGGILTFDDQFNGFNATEPGQVTSSDLAALVGAKVDFEVALDTSSFDPATGDVRDARFIGTGAMPEIVMWKLDALNMPIVLLSFQVDLLTVVQAPHSGSPLGSPDGKIVLGNPEPANFGISSNLTVAGGALNALVGGVGTRAVMELLMSSLNPKMTKTLRNPGAPGYLNLNFSNGVGTSQESTTWNINIVPEPGTAVLLGFALLGVVTAARRRLPR